MSPCDDDCCVCLENASHSLYQTTDCRHSLCFACLQKLHSKTCPICRRALNDFPYNEIETMLKNRQEYHEITFTHMVYNKITHKYVDHYKTLWIFQTMMYDIEYIKSETTDRLGVLLGEVWWSYPTSNLSMQVVMELYQRGLRGNIKL
jgi:hypothetical protein